MLKQQLNDLGLLNLEVNGAINDLIDLLLNHAGFVDGGDIDDWEEQLEAVATKVAHDAYVRFQVVLAQRHADLKQQMFLDGLWHGLAGEGELEAARKRAAFNGLEWHGARYETQLQEASQRFYRLAGAAAVEVVEGLQTALQVYYQQVEGEAFRFGVGLGERLRK